MKFSDLGGFFEDGQCYDGCWLHYHAGDFQVRINYYVESDVISIEVQDLATISGNWSGSYDSFLSEGVAFMRDNLVGDNEIDAIRDRVTNKRKNDRKAFLKESSITVKSSPIRPIKRMKLNRVFISYAREDYSYVNKLKASIEQSALEIEIWIDKEKLLPGVNWENEILNALEDSRFIVIILSDNSVNKTGFVQKEVKYALDRLEYFPPDKIVIIPVRIDNCEPKHRALKKIQRVDLFDNWDKGVNRIIASIKNQIG